MLEAAQHIRRMRGGSQAHLLRASDGNYYVTKFQNNPQELRVLANEYIATRLGIALGLPMPEVAVIQVSDWLINRTSELHIETGGNSQPCSSGFQLGSRYAINPETDQLFDYLPESLPVRNLHDFARVLVLDKWTGNADGRQVVFTKATAQRKYSATFIDQGYCFNAGEWNFPDTPLRGVYSRNYVYSHVTGWQDFEPVLTRAENMTTADLWKCTDAMPMEWCGNADELPRLIEQLAQRRGQIRGLIAAFRDSNRQPFPNWKENQN